MKPNQSKRQFVSQLGAALLSTSAMFVASTSAQTVVSEPVALGNNLDIVFIESDLKPKGLAASSDQDADLVNWGVPGLAALFQQRAPLVLAANGISGQARVIAPNADPEPKAATPAVVLNIDSVRKSRPRLLMVMGEVVFLATYSSGSSAAPPDVIAKIGGSSLGAHPALGILKTNRVDAQWVDEVVVLTLDQLAKQGLIKLPNAKAVLPRS